MRLVGLTGGIASGKSTVSKQLADLSIPVIDADKVAHEAQRKGTWGYARVLAAFGETVLDENREINRELLGRLVFSDTELRKKLNRAMQPAIAVGIISQVLRFWLRGARVVVLDAPLLFESKIDKFTKPVVVVYVEKETQIDRLINRSCQVSCQISNQEDSEEAGDDSQLISNAGLGRGQLSRQEAVDRIESQLPLDWKRGRADVVIDNSGSFEETSRLVQRLGADLQRPLTWRELVAAREGAAVAVAVALVLVAALWARGWGWQSME